MRQGSSQGASPKFPPKLSHLRPVALSGSILRANSQGRKRLGQLLRQHSAQGESPNSPPSSQTWCFVSSPTSHLCGPNPTRAAAWHTNDATSFSLHLGGCTLRHLHSTIAVGPRSSPSVKFLQAIQLGRFPASGVYTICCTLGTLPAGTRRSLPRS